MRSHAAMTMPNRRLDFNLGTRERRGWQASKILPCLQFLNGVKPRMAFAQFKRGLAFGIVALFVFSGVQAAINPGVPWPATDGLGRALPTPDEVGPPKPDRFVGIFYFLWHNEPDNKSPAWDGPYDVARILAKDPDALKKPDSPLWGPIGTSHYWGEPLYGYYLSTDPWVLRRHAHLLADAGIDTLIFDTTNARTYRDVYMKLCEVFRQVRQEGGHTPQIAFMVNTEAGKTAQQIYNDLYKPGLYPRPVVPLAGQAADDLRPAAGQPRAAASSSRSAAPTGRSSWSTRPTPGTGRRPIRSPTATPTTRSKPEQVNVSVAQNLRAERRQGDEHEQRRRPRAQLPRRQAWTPTPGAVNHGYNFQEQWKRAFELQPPFVMVTGWNEWIAGRWGEPDGPIVFVDQFDQEFSRDIEPMKGGHGDNYYWQLVANVRRYKGVAAAAEGFRAAVHPHRRRLRRSGATSRPSSATTSARPLPRDFDGAGGLHYTNRTGRNDLAALKVARDARNVYFYARTREPITPGTDPNWMWLLIDADQNAATGWEGYDFIVNRTIETDGTAWLEKNAGGWKWKKVAKVKIEVKGNELQLAIPREPLGFGRGEPRFDFKWADNLQKPGDIMDFYLSGDVAPEGRFNYRFLTE